MRTGDQIEVTIERMSHGEQAIARHPQADGRAIVIFVNGGAPGEKALVRLTKQNKKYWESEIVMVVSPSKDRVKPPCPVFGKCGGCDWQHLSYPAQMEAKKDYVLFQLEKSLKMQKSTLEEKLTLHPAKNPFNYRARVQVRGNAKGLGFFGRGSNDLIKVEKCAVVRPEIQETWETFARTRPLPELAGKAGQFKVEWSLTETGQIHESLNKDHAAIGFTQINPEQNNVLQDIVTNSITQCPTKDLLFDLYGGEGNLSRKVKGFAKTYCVDAYNSGTPVTEISKTADGLTIINARTREFLLEKSWLHWGKKTPDCVIADPPRNGLEECAEPIAKLGAQNVILVSCDPNTLARDLAAFITKYTVTAIHVLDMFPQTHHIETVVHLTKTSNS